MKLVPGTTPTAVRLLLQRCLSKDKRQRLQDAADVRIEIEDALSGPASTAPAVAQGGRAVRWRSAMIVGVAALASALFAGLAVCHEKPALILAQSAFVRPAVPLPADQELYLAYPAVGVSPNGAHLVFVATRRGLGQAVA